MLINCAVYQEGRKLADIEVDRIGDYLNQPGCFVWVALRDPAPDEMAAMQQRFDLHELAVEDALNVRQRPKIEEYGDTLFAVLHTVESNDDGALSLGQIAIFIGRNYALTVRSLTRSDFRDVRARCEREPHLLQQGSTYVMYALMDSVVDRYFPILETLETELDALEDRIFDKKNNTATARQLIEDMYTLKRRLLMLQHACTPLLEAVAKLHGSRVPQICSGMEHYFRDIYDHLLRITKIVDGRREMISTAIQVNLGMISLAESETTKRLGAFAAMFAIPTTIAGIFGMNFHRIPGLEWNYGYPVCLAAMVVIDLFLWWRFKKVGWL